MPYGTKVFDELCETYGLYPSIEFRDDIGGHHYDENNRVVYIDTLDERGRKWAVVHEFAHCIDKAHRRKAWDYHHHDKSFYNRLLGAIDVIYGDRAKYPWKYEYRQIRKWAAEDGYCAS